MSNSETTHMMTYGKYARRNSGIEPDDDLDEELQAIKVNAEISDNEEVDVEDDSTEDEPDREQAAGREKVLGRHETIPSQLEAR